MEAFPDAAIKDKRPCQFRGPQKLAGGDPGRGRGNGARGRHGHRIGSTRDIPRFCPDG